MARGVYYYMTENPAWLYAFAARSGIGSRLVRYCKFSASALLLFFVTDIHRYGAWYSGGATYIKPWWQYACILLWLPVLLFVIRCVFGFLDRCGSLLLMIPAWFTVIFTMCFLGACIVCMVDEGFYIFHGYVFLRGYQVAEILEGSLAFSAVYTAIESTVVVRDWLAVLLEKIFGG